MKMQRGEYMCSDVGGGVFFKGPGVSFKVCEKLSESSQEDILCMLNYAYAHGGAVARAKVRDALGLCIGPQDERIGTPCRLKDGELDITGYQVIHHEFDPAQGFMQWSTALAAAVLLFSAPKVYHAGRAMFGSGWQGLALVGILDGTMLWARTPWLIAAALCVQVFFNVVSVGCRLALKKS